MTKLFFDVFPTLKLDSDSQALFREVEVTKITSTSAKDHIKVHIFSTHLIPKKTVYDIERQIEMQLFSGMGIPVTILEEYRLSGLYTPENLMEAYRDSILFELEQRSVLEKSMFQKAKIGYEGENVILLTLADTIVAEGRTDALSAYLKALFEERFHVPVEIRVDYEKVKESKYRKFNEMQLQQEVDAILERNHTLQAQHAAGKEEHAGDASGGGSSEKKQQTGKKKENEAGKQDTKKQEQKRQEQACPVFKKCGGCRYLDLSYEKQVKKKEEQLRALLKPFCRWIQRQQRRRNIPEAGLSAETFRRSECDLRA